jgi:hypothetical protein
MRSLLTTVYNMIVTNAEALVIGLCVMLIGGYLWSDRLDKSTHKKVVFVVITSALIVSVYMYAPALFLR